MKIEVMKMERAAGLALAILAMGAPAMAQDVSGLVAYRSSNSSGSTQAARVIADMIAERSQSQAVRERARALRPTGAFSVGPDELLADIGADRFIDQLPVVQPVAATPSVAPVRTPRPAVAPAPAPAAVVAPKVTPAPVVATSPAPTPAPAVTPSPPPVATTVPVAAQSQPRQGRNWGVGPTATTDQGGGNSGGGGGGGGGGWN